MRWLPCWAPVALLAVVGPGSAAEYALSLTGPKSELTAVVVRVPLLVPMELAQAAATVRGLPGGGTVPAQLLEPGLGLDTSALGLPRAGQVQRELVFVVPQWPAGQAAEAVVELTPNVTAVPPRFAWYESPGNWSELRRDGQPVIRYHRAAYDVQNHMDTNKVFHHVFDPADPARLLTNGLGAKLYPHHRGILYGFNKTTYTDGAGVAKTVDTWHLPVASQRDAGTVRNEEGPLAGRELVRVKWLGEGNDHIANEWREVTVYDVAGGWLIDWVSRLEATSYTLRLDGDPQHAGLHFRANPQVADETAKQTYYLRTDGRGPDGETRNWDANHPDYRNYPWDAMSFVLDGQRYTVAYLDAPTNPKEARYSERDYGRFGSYFEHTLAPGRALTVRYRFWVQRGEMTVDQVNQLYSGFAAPPTRG